MTDIDKDIDLLPTNYYYTRLNTWFRKDGDESKCDKLERDLPNYSGIKDFCLKLTGNLRNFNRLKFAGPFEKYPCTILNYWTHDQLFNVVIKKGTSNNITDLISGIRPIWYKLIEATKCDVRSQMIFEKYFITMKKLYYYATNYDTIERHIKENGSKCNANIKNYLEAVDNLYNQTKGKCNSGRDLDCSVLKDIEQVYQLDKFKKLDCKVETSSILTSESDEQSLEGKQPGDPSNLISGAKTDAIDGTASNSVIGAIFPILGSSIIFFITYKFTPLKLWIQSRILGKKIIGHNSNEEDINESLENNYENFNAIEEYDHNISYNPL
ncbi:PIR Superfamily Protein [Plasmodium ovale curtisi]|uniref:PIR Superfamily Protein n=1 Tax=Plasmodium ovale curtisi TaxID=864141 RepID=A0A1A8WNI5_PLAOA|nr:PIR Superfamily Protein [Plasmodium ovale curtisi]